MTPTSYGILLVVTGLVIIVGGWNTVKPILSILWLFTIGSWVNFFLGCCKDDTPQEKEKAMMYLSVMSTHITMAVIYVGCVLLKTIVNFIFHG